MYRLSFCRLTPELLSQYKVIVIPTSWMDADQIEAIRTYRKNGEDLYHRKQPRTAELADVQSQLDARGSGE